MLPVIGASLPLLAGVVPESLPLGREIAITGRDAKKEAVIVLERVRSGQGDDGGVLARGMHFLENGLREGLLNLVKVCRAPGLFNAFLFRFGELLDMPVHGILCTESVHRYRVWL